MDNHMNFSKVGPTFCLKVTLNAEKFQKHLNFQIYGGQATPLTYTQYDKPVTPWCLYELKEIKLMKITHFLCILTKHYRAKEANLLHSA